MLQLPAGWPPLFSYEWWTDIGTPGLSGAGAILVGVVAIFVARSSHNLAEQVRTDELTREAAAAEEHYRDQFGHFIESAIGSLVEFGNAIEVRPFATAGERQLHAATQARLMLVHATAQGDDKGPTKAVYEVFHEVGHHQMYRVRRNVAGLLAGA